MRRTVPRRVLLALLAATLCVGACSDDAGGSDDAAASNGGAETSDENASDPEEPDNRSDDDSGGGDGAGGSNDLEKGSGVIDGDEFTLYSANCDLDGAELAAGAGTKTLDVNAGGVADSGVEVMITANRHAEDGMFGGDGVHIVFLGDRPDGINSVMGTFDDERLIVDGNSVSGTDLVLADPVSGTELVVSFEVQC